MSKFLTPGVSRVAVGMAVLGAFAVVPFAAQAADTNATGTLSAGSLSDTAPVIAPFTATLTGDNQTVNTAVGGWSVTSRLHQACRAGDGSYPPAAPAC